MATGLCLAATSTRTDDYRVTARCLGAVRSVLAGRVQAVQGRRLSVYP